MHFQKIFSAIIFLIGSFFLLESCSEKESINFDEIKEQVEPVSPLWKLHSSEIFREADRKFCFELEFPVELHISDNATKSLNSHKELQSFIETWYKENSENLKNEPTINYPLKTTLENGTLTELNDDTALFALIEDCLTSVHLDFFKMLPSRCYQIDYPITIAENNGTAIEFESYEDVFESLFTSDLQPINIEFPFNITLNNQQIIINSEQDLDNSIGLCHDFLNAQSHYYNTTFYCYIITSEVAYWIEQQDDYWFLEECFKINYPVTIVSKQNGEMKIGNNEEFIDVVKTILNSMYYYHGEENSIDFSYPVMVTLVEEDRTISLNSGDEFIKLFEHCQ